MGGPLDFERPSPRRCEPAGRRRQAPGGSRSCTRVPETVRAPRTRGGLPGPAPVSPIRRRTGWLCQRGNQPGALPMLSSRVLTEYLKRMEQDGEFNTILAFDEWLQSLPC